ncbi:MAG: hypothetical protein NTY46_02860 [Candidatus Sumerlaeota bacterium]|nr:hypothetical protein [Candidatus Sumerlaeota bacterium]
MHNLIKIAAAAVLAGFVATANAVVIESFDTNDWTVIPTSNDITANGASASTSLEPVIKVEGSNALKLTYNYSGLQWYEVGIEKTYITPIDLSGILDMNLQIRGDANSAPFVWYVNFIGENGKYYRYVGWTPDIPNDAWQNFRFCSAQMEWNRWQAARDLVEISKIVKIQIYVQKRDGSISAGATNILFDALEGFTTAGARVVSETLADFDSYADTAELQAAWPTAISGDGNALSVALVPDNASGKAMRMDITLAKRWWNLAATKTLTGTLDLTQYKYLTYWMKGDATLADQPGAAPIMFLKFRDSADNNVRAWSQTTLKKGDWYCVYLYQDANRLPFTPSSPDNADIGTDGSTKMLADERWDAGSDCVLTDINRIQFSFIENNLDFDPPYTAQIIIGKLIGYKYVEPSAVGEWSMY